MVRVEISSLPNVPSAFWKVLTYFSILIPGVVPLKFFLKYLVFILLAIVELEYSITGSIVIG